MSESSAKKLKIDNNDSRNMKVDLSKLETRLFINNEFVNSVSGKVSPAKRRRGNEHEHHKNRKAILT